MSDDILSRIDEAMARNAERFDPLGGQRHAPGIGDEMRWQPKDGTEELTAPAGHGFMGELHVALDEHASDLARIAAEPRYRCRGCRLWIAQDVKLCGPCSALPPCRAVRSAVEWGGRVVCFRPDGHDGQHETVEGRCWMDRPPFLLAAIDAQREEIVERIGERLATLTVATPEEAAADTLTMETRSLECSRSRPMCSGCDGAAAWGSGPCLHECHAELCRNCDQVIVPSPETSTGWTHGDVEGAGHGGRWVGIRCRGMLATAQPDIEVERRRFVRRLEEEMARRAAEAPARLPWWKRLFGRGA